MSSSVANIDALNQAIEDISQDAESMHGLIAGSTDELKRATDAGKRMAEEAERVAYALVPLSKQVESQREDTSILLEETKAQRTAIMETLEKSFEAAGAERDESFRAFSNKALNEVEKARDTLQTDFLSFKTSIGARIDSLEGQAARVNSAVEGLSAQTTKLEESVGVAEGKLRDRIDTIKSKLLVPICAAVGLGVANLICLIVLLLR